MPSSGAANFPRLPGLARAIVARAIQASPLAARVVQPALVGLGDTTFAAERGAIAAIAIRPAAARLLAAAKLAPMVRAGEGFPLAARAPAVKSAKSRELSISPRRASSELDATSSSERR